MFPVVSAVGMMCVSFGDTPVPAKSQSQQRLFGMIHAYQTGKMRKPPQKIRLLAGRISPEAAEDFARTSHDDLPEKVAWTAEDLQEIATPPETRRHRRVSGAVDAFLQKYGFARLPAVSGPPQPVAAAPATIPATTPTPMTGGAMAPPAATPSAVPPVAAPAPRPPAIRNVIDLYGPLGVSGQVDGNHAAGVKKSPGSPASKFAAATALFSLVSFGGGRNVACR